MNSENLDNFKIYQNLIFGLGGITLNIKSTYININDYENEYQ